MNFQPVKTRPAKFNLKVTQKETVGPNIIKLRLEMGKVMDFIPGQFVSLFIDERTRRSYSISSVPGQLFIETYNDITPAGPGSKFFEAIEIGQEITGMFPLGRFIYEESKTPAIFIATGTGITPFMSMFEFALKQTSRQIKLIWGAKYETEIFLKAEIESFKKQYSNFDYLFCITREETQYIKGRVTKLIENMEFDPHSEFYICGGQNMIKDVEDILINKGFSKEKIKYEQFY